MFGRQVLCKTPRTKDKMVQAMGGEKEYKKLTKSKGFFKKLAKGLTAPSGGSRSPTVQAPKSKRSVSTLEQDTDTVNKVFHGGHDTVNF